MDDAGAPGGSGQQQPGGGGGDEEGGADVELQEKAVPSAVFGSLAGIVAAQKQQQGEEATEGAMERLKKRKT